MQNRFKFKLSVVVPSYNEEQNVLVLAERLTAVFNAVSIKNYQVIFVNDGSSDDTLKNLQLLHEQDKHIEYISFSRNFGHQCALRAGLDYADGDCVVSMDADMQHPPELIPDMIAKWQEGYDIVYTLREESKKLSLFKRWTSKAFYGVINKLSNIKIQPGAADFRLLDRKVVDVLKQFKENTMFYRGIISWMGFKQYGIVYQPADRLYGTSKYTIKKMFAFALSGITSFSVFPLQISTIIGTTISIFAFIYTIYALIIHFFTDKAVSGWTSILICVLFLGGIQLIMLGIIGEYIGKLFIESKHRPPYIVGESSFDKD